MSKQEERSWKYALKSYQQMREKSEVSLCGNLIDIKYQIPFHFYFFSSIFKLLCFILEKMCLILFTT